jgi:hypothetical protein
VFIPRVPFADEHTDLNRQLGELPVEGPAQIGPGPLVWSGQLHALIPLMLARLGPLGELLVIQLPIGLDRTHDMPVLTAAECEQPIGGIPTVEKPIDQQTRGQQLL